VAFDLTNRIVMTAGNELYKPIGPSRSEGGIRISVGLVPASVGVGVAVAAVALWIAVIDDPLGGEPRAFTALPTMPPARAEPPAPPAAAPVVAGAAARPGVLAPGPAPQTVSIITPGGAGQPMQVRVVTVPESRGPGGLANAPDDRFSDKTTRHGILPRIANDGTRPWRHYARPSEARGDGPRIAVLVGGLGLSSAQTDAAIDRLPADVTLAFTPYATGLQAQVNRARNAGHEVVLQVPMEPFDYPANDPGPQALMSSLPTAQNVERLNWALGRFTGYIGIVNQMGEKFTGAAEAVRPILAELRNRGLAVVDDGRSQRSLVPRIAREIGLGHAAASIVVDADPNPQAIDDALARIEEQANREGTALLVATALPVTVERLTRWMRTLEARGITVVPVSAIVTGDRPDAAPAPAPRS
jgi:polysaccharide deacetylase 2 family uncharacterized protein YibQ